MKFDELFAPDLPAENYGSVYVNFEWFDLYRAAGHFPCLKCGKPTRWRWYEFEDYPASPTCSPECMERDNETEESEAGSKNDAGAGPDVQCALSGLERAECGPIEFEVPGDDHNGPEPLEFAEIGTEGPPDLPRDVEEPVVLGGLGDRLQCTECMGN